MGSVKQALERTLYPMLRHQNRNGSYSFYHHPYDDRVWRRIDEAQWHRSPISGRYPKERPPEIDYQHEDVTFTAWNYQALKAAFAAGVEVEGIEEAIQNGIKYLKSTNQIGHSAPFVLGFSARAIPKNRNSASISSRISTNVS
jgi:hypothetical protein